MYVKRVDAQTSIEVLCAVLAVQKVPNETPPGVALCDGMPDKDEERKFAAVAVKQLKC